MTPTYHTRSMTQPSNPTKLHPGAHHVPAWRGWVRRRGEEHWTEVCQGETYSSCWSELLSRYPTAVGLERRVSQGGVNLNDRPTPAKRRY